MKIKALPTLWFLLLHFLWRQQWVYCSYPQLSLHPGSIMPVLQYNDISSNDDAQCKDLSIALATSPAPIQSINKEQTDGFRAFMAALQSRG